MWSNGCRPERLPDLMDTSDKDRENCSVLEGDVFLTRTSETPDELAMSCVSLKNYTNATFSGFAKRLRPINKGLTYPKYMAFYLRSPYFRKVINNNTIMTLRASFNEDMFSFLNLYLPKYEEQVKIGDLLYLIEKKIQLNEQINNNLEQQAMSLYDYYFTQFDFPSQENKPYRTSGGNLVWNNELKSNIPSSWSSISLSDIINILSGFAFSSDLYVEKGKYPLYTIKNVQDGGIVTSVDNYINNLPPNLPDYCLLKSGDILTSLTGNVGRVGVVYENNALLNQRVAKLSPKYHDLYPFVLYTMKSKLIRKKIEMIAIGSSQANISPLDIVSLKIPFNRDIALLFSQRTQEIVYKCISNMKETASLISLRNFLLPMLMNGQATIKE